ncbi:MAG TPA: hypothetical protein VFN97_16990 [Actinospica sp.]|nr:hypothetical protein [Actinospica sp.]
MVRLGVLATAALGTVGTIGSIAQAVTLGDGFSSDTGGTAVANNYTFALSNAGDQTSFKDSFTVHQYGSVNAAYLRNQAIAESVSCSPDAPCRSVSLSFQIATMAGTDIHLDAVNLSDAQNVHCAGCQTVAGAYQFVVSTPGAFTLNATARAQLDRIHHELNALSNSKLSADQVQSAADALAMQVASILKTAAATSPEGPVEHALTGSFSPKVTVYRDFQQH